MFGNLPSEGSVFLTYNLKCMQALIFTYISKHLLFKLKIKLMSENLTKFI